MADKTLAKAGKRLATSGPYKEGRLEDIPLNYLQTSGSKVHDDFLRSYAKAKVGLAELEGSCSASAASSKDKHVPAPSQEQLELVPCRPLGKKGSAPTSSTNQPSTSTSPGWLARIFNSLKEFPQRLGVVMFLIFVMVHPKSSEFAGKLSAYAVRLGYARITDGIFEFFNSLWDTSHMTHEHYIKEIVHELDLSHAEEKRVQVYLHPDRTGISWLTAILLAIFTAAWSCFFTVIVIFLKCFPIFIQTLAQQPGKDQPQMHPLLQAMGGLLPAAGGPG